MTLRKILISAIGLGCSWIGTSSAGAQVVYPRGVSVVAVVHFDGEPKTAASVQMQRELQYYESSNRLFAAQQQYWANQRAAYQYIDAQRQWQAQQLAMRNQRPLQRPGAKKAAKQP